MLKGYNIVESLADGLDHIIPGHDPLLLSRFPSAPGQGGVLRLDLPPVWLRTAAPAASEPQQETGDSGIGAVVERRLANFGEATMAAAAQRAMTPREWGLLALLSLLWGGSYLFVAVAVREIPPLTLVTLRVGFAAALLWVCALILGVALPRSRKAIGALAVLGFGNNAVPFALITWGQTHLPGGLASILTAATPLSVPGTSSPRKRS